MEGGTDDTAKPHNAGGQAAGTRGACRGSGGGWMRTGWRSQDAHRWHRRPTQGGTIDAQGTCLGVGWGPWVTLGGGRREWN